MNNALGKANGSNPMDDSKTKALAAALAQIEKQFGKGSIMKMGEAQVQNDLSVVSTGSLGLDIALGVGGLAARSRRRSLWPRVVGQDDAVPPGRRRKCRRRAVSRRTSTPKMRSTRSTPASSGSRSATC